MVGRVVAANLVLDAEVMPAFMQRVYEDDAGEPDKPPKLTIPERQKLLMEILEKDGRLNMLNDWPEKEATDAR